MDAVAPYAKAITASATRMREPALPDASRSLASTAPLAMLDR